MKKKNEKSKNPVILPIRTQRDLKGPEFKWRKKKSM